jgi:taurine transport system permease protein
MRRQLTPRRRFAISVAAVASVLVLWQLSGMFEWTSRLILPPPTEIVQAAQDLLGDGYRQTSLWGHVLASLARAVSAFVVAVVVGVPLGLLMGMYPTLNAVLDPFVQFLRPLPKLALIPLVIVWFGIGEVSKFLLIFIATLLVIIVGSAAAVMNVKEGRIRAALALGVNRYQLFRYVILPHALPELFISVRLGIGIGWTTLIAAEMIAATSGLGWMVLNASSYLRTDIVMLGILILGITGYALDLMLVAVQHAVVPWMGKE